MTADISFISWWNGIGSAVYVAMATELLLESGCGLEAIRYVNSRSGRRFFPHVLGSNVLIKNGRSSRSDWQVYNRQTGPQGWRERGQLTTRSHTLSLRCWRSLSSPYMSWVRRCSKMLPPCNCLLNPSRTKSVITVHAHGQTAIQTALWLGPPFCYLPKIITTWHVLTI